MKRTLSSQVANHVNQEVTVEGWIHKIRKLGGINFVVLRDREGLVQAIVEKAEAIEKLSDLTTESVVRVSGQVVKEDRAPGGAEIHVTDITVLAPVKEDVPVEINKKELRANLDTLLDYRPITLRALSQRAIFEIEAGIAEAFRQFLLTEGFTEIETPKIVSQGAETGGAEMFKLDYFGKKAFLAQSPQLYKQMMVGVFERVFETNFAYRAEPHSTSRHINEYLSLDLEMGFIKNHEDIMELENRMLKFIMDYLRERYSKQLEVLGANLPEIPAEIPKLKLREAQEILEKEYNVKAIGEPDLEPNHEKMICEYATKKLGSEFVFITHYPSKKRPFYVMDDPEDPGYTLSFDLLFRGLEVTTGGQRLHLYEDYLRKMEDKGMTPSDFNWYLMAFRYGMPPHGGLAIGLERLVMKILDMGNIREASLFPRDLTRLKP